MEKPVVEATHTLENQVQKYYTWRASNYDAGSAFEAEHHAEAIQLAQIQPGQRVLDAACGTGRATAGLAQAVGPSGQVAALSPADSQVPAVHPALEEPSARTV